MPTENEIDAAARVLAASYSVETKTLGAIDWRSLARRTLEAAERERPTVVVDEHLTQVQMGDFVATMSRELLAPADEIEKGAAR